MKHLFPNLLIQTISRDADMHFLVKIHPPQVLTMCMEETDIINRNHICKMPVVT